ncbi:MAG: hypothetical protein ACFFEA_14945 [Candidatus Thorarchaeota archaeon]
MFELSQSSQSRCFRGLRRQIKKKIVLHRPFMRLVTAFLLQLIGGITCIILRIMCNPSTSKGMANQNQAPSVEVGFNSLTRNLVDSTGPKPRCPECDAEIDFSVDLEWMGPTAFLCKRCEQVIELNRIKNL